jgi:phenol 2-monooxygenase
MARCGINTRIIDSRGTKVINGHADGLRERTQEILDSLGCGVQEKAEAEGHIHEHFKTWVGYYTATLLVDCVLSQTDERD